MDEEIPTPDTENTEGEHQKLLAEKTELENKVKELQEKLNEANTRAESVKTQLESRISELEEKLKSTEQRAQELEAEIGETKRSLTQAVSDKDALEDEIKRLRETNNELQQEITKLRNEVNDAKNEADQLRKEKQEAEEKIMSLQEELQKTSKMREEYEAMEKSLKLYRVLGKIDPAWSWVTILQERETMTIRQLAMSAGVSQSKLQEMLQDLEKHGVVRLQTEGPEDTNPKVKFIQ